MDKRELKIDYFVCRNSVPACYRGIVRKSFWPLPAKLIASIPILLSERLFCWKMGNDRFRQ